MFTYSFRVHGRQRDLSLIGAIDAIDPGRVQTGAGSRRWIGRRLPPVPRPSAWTPREAMKPAVCAVTTAPNTQRRGDRQRPGVLAPFDGGAGFRVVTSRAHAASASLNGRPPCRWHRSRLICLTRQYEVSQPLFVRCLMTYKTNDRWTCLVSPLAARLRPQGKGAGTAGLANRGERRC